MKQNAKTPARQTAVALDFTMMGKFVGCIRLKRLSSSQVEITHTMCNYAMAVSNVQRPVNAM